MKIGFDAKRFYNNKSGLGNYSRDLIRILNQFYPENQFLLYSKKVTELGENVLPKSSSFFRKLKKNIAARQTKMGMQAQEDNCHIFHGLSGEIPLFWNNQPIKKIVTIHDLIFVRFPQFYSLFDRFLHFWKFKFAANNADLIIAISEQTKKDIIEFLKIKEDKIKVIYQGCHNAFKQEHIENTLIEIKLKYQLPEKFILSVGTIEERKNLLTVLKAINNTKIILVVVGAKTKYFNKIKAYIERNSLQNQVIFLEKVSMQELAIIYKLATIFVYPSLFEGFGIPIIEALFSKIPVITSNLGCFPEAGGEHSVYVNPLDANELRKKITDLWENELKRNEIAKKSFEFVQQFNDQKIGLELMETYKNLLN